MTSNDTPPGAVSPGIRGNLGVWIAFGSAFGLLFGVVVGGFSANLALGVSLGLSLGAGLGVAAWAVFSARRNTRGE
ncbi:hypothetical protein Ait01nite_026870 [Actinoplanes italicus]|uniref:Uncharacterized protein n=1 Tax=Actinoplanes italicus TaxID=113567 RepID=A0A2T0KEY4_9ACTN|nr:hypothetical protein CLV67_105118 [Actinoplanes italicus]GIE29642.1 hypothetical protein Ait01nite_026870 [Actinoplanes italicus]